MAMRTSVANHLLIMIKSKIEKDVLFGLREIVKRQSFSYANSKLFSSLGIAPTLLDLLPNENEMVTLYVCKIFLRLENWPFSLIVESRKLPILLNKLIIGDTSKEVLCCLCKFIAFLAVKHTNSREEILCSTVPRKLVLLLEKYENDPQVTKELIQVIRSLMHDKYTCHILSEAKCVLAVCNYGLKEDFSNEMLLVSMKALQNYMYLDPSIDSLQQISEGTANFTRLPQLITLSDEMAERVLGLVFNLMKCCKRQVARVKWKKMQDGIIRDIVLAHIPKAFIELLQSSNATIKKRAFELLTKILTWGFVTVNRDNDTGFATLNHLWTQIVQVNGCEVVLKILTKPDIENGMLPYEIRKTIMATLIYADNVCTRVVVAANLIKAGLVSVFVELFSLYGKFSLDPDNLPPNFIATKKKCGHLPESFLAQNLKRTAATQTGELPFSNCLELMGLLLKLLLMGIRYGGEVSLEKLKSCYDILIKHIKEGCYVFDDAITLLMRYVESQQRTAFPFTVKGFLLSHLKSITLNGNQQCDSCMRISVALPKFSKIVDNDLSIAASVMFPTDTDTGEKMLQFVTAYVFCARSAKKLLSFNEQFRFVSTLLEYISGDHHIQHKEFAFNSLLFVGHTLKIMHDKLSIGDKHRILEAMCVLCFLRDRMVFDAFPYASGEMMEHSCIAAELIHPSGPSSCKLTTVQPDTWLVMTAPAAQSSSNLVTTDESIQVNRKYLASKNQVFDAMLFGYFKEATEDNINIDLWSHKLFNFFIHVIYGCQCNVLRTTEFSLQDATHLFFLGDMYDCPGLSLFALHRMAAAVDLKVKEHLDLVVNLEGLLAPNLYVMFLAMALQYSRQQDMCEWIYLLKNAKSSGSCLMTGLNVLMRFCTRFERFLMSGDFRALRLMRRCK